MTVASAWARRVQFRTTVPELPCRNDSWQPIVYRMMGYE
jgi:hypothetical protein